MAIYFVLVIVIWLYGNQTHPYLSDRRRRNFIIFSFGLMILVAALRSTSVGYDLTAHYAKRFLDVANYDISQMQDFSRVTGYEIGYCYFIKILSLISPDVQFYIIVTSIIIYGVMGVFVYKHCDDVSMATFLTIFLCLFYMYMNIIRQALAVSIVLIGYSILTNSKSKIRGYIALIVAILVAATFHSSAILCFIMVIAHFLKFTRRQVLTTIVCVVAVFMVYESLYTGILDILGNFGENYYRYLESGSAENIGNFNFQSLWSFLLTAGAFALGVYVWIWKPKQVPDVNEELSDIMFGEHSFLLYMCLLATICRLLLFRMNIINRFSYYFMPFVVITYPLALKDLNDTNRKTVRISIYIIMFLYFTYMTIFKAESFYGVTPYQFFW